MVANNLTRIANTISQGSTPVVPPINFGFNGGAGGGSSLTLQTWVPVELAWRGAVSAGVSMLADPFTGAEVIESFGNQTFVLVVGGTSLAPPMFSG